MRHEMEREDSFLGDASEGLFGRSVGAARELARESALLAEGEFVYFGALLVLRALILVARPHNGQIWARSLFYLVPPFVRIPHIMTPLASSHARTKSAPAQNNACVPANFLISVDSDRSRLALPAS